ncbi:DUF1402 family protein [Polycladidibacter stylochi]|uniref:DUF1402 family protein n=1 Tax=Polycladidibacter stylochi TaxID=1807766 RepID=UPI00082F2AEC|nr:DUF1402 family protein [Pseudovibrio stylochi]
MRRAARESKKRPFFSPIVKQICITTIAYFLCFSLVSPPLYAADKLPLQVVPGGNRNEKQPTIPGASHQRTKARKTSFERKYQRILALLKRDKSLHHMISSVAKTYDIPPSHLAGAIIGEHTYNYDSLDTAQSYYLKALEYAGIPIVFQYNGEALISFIKRPQFSGCLPQSSAKKWRCIEQTWKNKFQGKGIGNESFPNISFSKAFLHPLFAGQSFGIGQITPLTALKMDDITVQLGHLQPLDINNPKDLYRKIMDPKTSLHYSAAVIKDAITAYKETARTDITNNLGITATLYNLGNPWERARQHLKKRIKHPGLLPQENYYGWLINVKQREITALFEQTSH